MLPLQTILPGVLADVISRQPPSREKTSFVWSVAVGPALARATTAELRGSVLVVTARDARWAGEIARARETILARVRHFLGNGIAGIEVVTE